MKVIEHKHLLIIESYPVMRVSLCLFIIAFLLFTTISWPINPLVTILAFICTCFILCTTTYRLTVFDFLEHQMLQSQYSIRGKKSTCVSFGEISEVKLVSQKRLLCSSSQLILNTKAGKRLITSFSDATKKENQQLANKIKESLPN